ncbi:DNA-processing protein DprA [Hyphobacterium marinum]|uniref:DNA-processing protein DprA n=1 Tax=Hyphobacterium marinum TaxID=3116574 RepID=A0ABU7LZ30_9PROT|nr:DNA-processing protein DprA [Hyphobacterium sp. Y6023]MEE2566819.1 DNA-processing protein DprA [Hyphobacterium sp. Y6023]
MNREALSPSERTAWLRLARTPQVGPVTFAKLIARFGTASEALDALPDLARRGGRSTPLTSPSREEAEAELEATEEIGGKILMACEPDYPARLAEIDPPPPVISVMGPLNPNERTSCAIVGARNASAVGVRFARELAQGLADAGVIVVSGLARGIDGAAHNGSLNGGTIAVLAGGIDHIYPPEHAELHREIARRGLIVSESRLGMSPTARDFPRRNRLISGLSLGTVVVEAAMRSGSLITARLAAEQGREVMAVPGSPLDPRAKGSNRLIRDGAALVEGVDDVLDILGGLRRDAAEPSPPPYSPDPDLAGIADDDIDNIRERIADLLSPSPVSADELSRQTGAPAGLVMAALLELELAGRAEVAPGGQVRAAYPDPS